ncbi:hypothetical protein JWG39_12675 [Desulforhopalus vacuolatus]|uniref:hypothetical protein n=1 Tax=Desulforhopalus vacuolatus TaxID=40414 RepID=UPI001966081E|nr:hypothetical protein [Desulforhopalus vacuolatus]MBM9520668.1 hypothetical protein [Desulforhopalus vacuolatus]
MKKIALTICLSMIVMIGYTSAYTYTKKWTMDELKKGVGWYNPSGYSFHCEKYFRDSVIQSCLKEESKAYKKSKGNIAYMKIEHQNLEKSWAKYNLKMSGDFQSNTYNSPSPAKKKHLTDKQREQKRFDDRVYQNGVIASRSYNNMLQNMRQIGIRENNEQGDPRLYQTIIRIESNYNYYYNCIIKTASIDMAKKFNHPYNNMEKYMAENIESLFKKCNKK